MTFPRLERLLVASFMAYGETIPRRNVGNPRVRVVTRRGPYLSPNPSLRAKSMTMGDRYGMKSVNSPAEKMIEENVL